MEFFLARQKAGTSLLKAVFDASSKAEAAREREEAAATRLQSSWRAYRDRSAFQYTRQCIVGMQRVCRGHLGRRRAKRRTVEKKLAERQAMFDHLACCIQRVFRGFYVRKWVSDYHSKKRYLREIEARSNEVRQVCNEHYLTQTAEAKMREQDEYVESFSKLSSKMLYLASTAAIPGVLSSKGINPVLHSTFGESAEGALRMHRKKFKRSLPTRKPDLLSASTTATGLPVVDDRPRKPFVTSVKSDKTLLSKPLKTFAA